MNRTKAENIALLETRLANPALKLAPTTIKAIKAEIARLVKE